MIRKSQYAVDLEAAPHAHHLFPKIACASSLLFATHCWAGTSDPIGVGRLILLVGGVLLGLIFFISVSSNSKLGAAGLILYLLALAAGGFHIHHESELVSRRSDAVLREFDERQARHTLAFKDYCKSRHRKILEYAHHNPKSHPKGKGSLERSIFVRIDNEMPGGSYQFNALRIASQLREKPSDCNQTGIKFVEGEKYLNAARIDDGSTKNIDRYSACSTIDSEAIERSTARFELILGETIDKKQLTRESENMSSVSVRLVDRRQGRVLAEDQMFFLQHASGLYGCPEGLSELSALVLEVFGPAAPR